MIKQINQIKSETQNDFFKIIYEMKLDSSCIRSKNRIDRKSIWIKHGTNLCPIRPINNEDFVRLKVYRPPNRYVLEPTTRLSKFLENCMNSINQKWDSGLITKGTIPSHKEHSIFNPNHICIALEDSKYNRNIKLNKGCIYYITQKPLYMIEGYVLQIFTFIDNYEQYYPKYK